MLRGLSFVAREGLHQALVGRWRAKRYAARRESFVHRTTNGLLFRLDPGEVVDRDIAVHGIYERRFLAFVRRALPEGAVVLDIGANIGNHALFLHDICSEIHCFEPNPRAWQRLEQNIALNNVRNIRVHRVGLGAGDGDLPFSDNVSGNLGAGTFIGRTDGGTWNIIRLPIRNADNEIERLGLTRIDFIKIDVEGMERDLLEALKCTIGKHRPLLSFEYHGQLLGTEPFEDIRKTLSGYQIAELSYARPGGSALERVLYHLRHAGHPHLKSVHLPERRTYENLLAIPDESPLAQNVR